MPWKPASEPDIPGRDNLKTIALCEAVLVARARAPGGPPR